MEQNRMKTIQTIGKVTKDGVLTVNMPPDIQPGDHSVVVVIDEKSRKSGGKRKRLHLPVDQLGKWPENLSLRREDLYGAPVTPLKGGY